MSQLELYVEEVKAFYHNHKIVCQGLFAVFAGFKLFRWVTGELHRRKRNKKRSQYPHDTVILHHLGRGPYAPSLVPFAVKLETYLRMAKIPYQCEHSPESSSKKKYPWITYNGADLADSTFIIDTLNKRLNIDLNAGLSSEQRAVGVAFQRLVEDDLYWVLVVARWVSEVDADFMKRIFGSALVANLILKLRVTPKIRKVVWAQGMGRHSQGEVRDIARKDLTALSNYLGSKKFLMGDKPCEVDCTVFGQLSQVYWQLPGSVGTMFKEDFPQLVAYCERMKDMFWPDWVECTTQGGTTEATR